MFLSKLSPKKSSLGAGCRTETKGSRRGHSRRSGEWHMEEPADSWGGREGKFPRVAAAPETDTGGGSVAGMFFSSRVFVCLCKARRVLSSLTWVPRAVPPQTRGAVAGSVGRSVSLQPRGDFFLNVINVVGINRF